MQAEANLGSPLQYKCSYNGCNSDIQTYAISLQVFSTPSGGSKLCFTDSPFLYITNMTRLCLLQMKALLS